MLFFRFFVLKLRENMKKLNTAITREIKHLFQLCSKKNQAQ